MKIRTVVLAIVLFITCPAYAEFWDGNKLVGFMREYEKAVRSEPGAKYQDAASFSGFVIGVHDSQQAEFCSPGNTTVGQVGAVVVKYMNAHPEQWNQAAHNLVLRALKEAFPCPSTVK